VEHGVEVEAVMTARTGSGSGVRSDVLFALFFDCRTPNATMMVKMTVMIPLTVATSKNTGFTSPKLRPGFNNMF
jgi:hypothetical protein